MKKIFLLILTVSFMLPSCISQKKYAALEAVNQQSKDLLNSATLKLNTCFDKTQKLLDKLNKQYYEIVDPNNSLKISVRFLSNEITATSIKIIVHERRCSGPNRCAIKVLNSKIREELTASILETATILQKNVIKK
jgi:hypothetical protein